MDFFEYKSIVIGSGFSSDSRSDRIARILNQEGAKGWEVCGTQPEPEAGESVCPIRFIMKRPCKSVLAPYMSLDFSEDQLNQIYRALQGPPVTKVPLSIEALDYFLEHAKDIFNRDVKALSYFHCDWCNDDFDYKQALDATIDQYKE